MSVKLNEPLGLVSRTAGMQPDPIGAPLSEPEAILNHESHLLFRHFTADTAFALGTHLRNRLHAISPTPALIRITLSSTSVSIFQAASHPGTTLDNSLWLDRKTATALRWGKSTWYMGRRFLREAAATTSTTTSTASSKGSSTGTLAAGSGGMAAAERAFAEKFSLSEAERGKYAIHGGAVPVRVEGVEGVVAVVAVSGLSQEEDHQVVVEGLEDCRVEMAGSGGYFSI